MDEEFELVPMSPIRSLEKRLKDLEQNSSGHIMKELVDVVKTNQKIVDDLVRINSSAIKEMSEVNINLKMLIERLDNFIDRIDVATSQPSDELMDKINQIIDQNTKMSESYEQLTDRLSKVEKRVNAILLTKMRGVRGAKR